MSRIFVTGSADGLGRMAARLMVSDGHRVVLHARNEARAAEALAGVPRAETVVVGDLSSIEECRQIAAQVNKLGRFDAVIHNAGVGYREPKQTTADGLPHVFAINTLAPYVLTALIDKPKRLVYLSSGMHYSGDPSLKDLTWSKRAWNGSSAYADSKAARARTTTSPSRSRFTFFAAACRRGWMSRISSRVTIGSAISRTRSMPRRPCCSSRRRRPSSRNAFAPNGSAHCGEAAASSSYAFAT